MKVIVTGGAGFLGSHLSEKLLQGGNGVICIDNLLTGFEENISHLRENPNFKFIKANVSLTLPDELQADQIYHLASPASPNKINPNSYIAHSFETMLVNTTGTWNLCELAAKTGAKLVFASTSEVYGDPEEHPQKETYRGNVSTIGPRSVYDESKRFGETIVSEFVRKKKLNATTVRIFNTYGPKMADDGRVVITFIKAALEGEPLPIFGQGKQSRSFCFVDDLVDGLIAAMEKGGDGEVFNLGNPDEYNILELAQRIKELNGSDSKFEFHPLPEDDPMQRCPDITLAREKLGWEPKISLDEGLKKFIEYLKNADY